MSRYAMVGRSSGELLSYGGRVIVHGDRDELQFLFPRARVVRITDGDLGQPTMLLAEHPSMVSVRWPLRREDFVDMQTRGD